MPKLPPPSEHQFKKGNKGKPKGALNVKTRMIKALLKKVEYPDLYNPNIDGKGPTKVTGPMINYMIESLIKQALKGNTKAFEILIDRTEGPIKFFNNDQDAAEDDFIERVLIQVIDSNGNPIGPTQKSG